MSGEENPPGWTHVKVSQLVGSSGLFVDGDWVESKDQDPSGSIRLLQLADIGDGVFLDKSDRWINEAAFHRLRCTELQPGDVLIARMPDPLGRACLMPQVPSRCVTVVDVAALRVDPGLAEGRWVMRTINAPQARAAIEMQASGTTRKRISRGNLGELPLPLPPLAEQRRIADKLDTVLARVDSVNDRLARVAPLLKRFRQSVLAAAASGELTEEWRLRIGVDWKPENMTIGQIGEVVTGSTPSKRVDTFYGGDVPFFKPSDLDAGYEVHAASEYLSLLGAEEARTLPERSVLVTCIGATIGKTGLARRRCATNQQINAIICGEKVLPEWVYFWACGPIAQSAIIGNASATTLPILNKSRFSALEMAVPSKEEQREVVRRVELLFAYADRLEARLQAAQTATGRLTPSLLAKAFRGELVAQDPNDERASELLVRLAAQRAQAGSTSARPRGRKPSALTS